MVAHRASSYADAEVWDLDFWQSPLPRHRGLAFIFHADLDTLIDIKSRIDDPRHQEDVRVLKMVRDRRATE